MAMSVTLPPVALDPETCLQETGVGWRRSWTWKYPSAAPETTMFGDTIGAKFFLFTSLYEFVVSYIRSHTASFSS
jgi:hypothetical protein